MDQVENLNMWAQRLLQASVLLPILGGSLGGSTAIARYFVEQKAKRLVAAAYAAEITRLRKRTEPRSIQNLPPLVDALRAITPARFSTYYSGVDTEQKNLGDAIRQAFVSAGWELRGVTGPHMPPDTPSGVSIVIRDGPRAAELRSLLIPLLRSHGIDVVEQGDKSIVGRVTLPTRYMALIRRTMGQFDGTAFFRQNPDRPLGRLRTELKLEFLIILWSGAKNPLKSIMAMSIRRRGFWLVAPIALFPVNRCPIPTRENTVLIIGNRP
jgi:hypothetical protein